MRRRWILGAAFVGATAVLLSMGRVPPGDAEAETPPASASVPAARVQVSHRLVTTEPVAVALSRAPDTRAGVRVASTSPGPRRRARATAGLMTRAKEALLGDGRHRPEPFPRIKDN